MNEGARNMESDFFELGMLQLQQQTSSSNIHQNSVRLCFFSGDTTTYLVRKLTTVVVVLVNVDYLGIGRLCFLCSTS